jgi:hypothetical protein
MPTVSRLTRAGMLALGVGVGSLGLAACGDDDEESADNKPKTLAVSIDQAGKVTAPTSTDGGVVTLRFTNNAQAPYALQMVRVTGNKTTADVLKIINSEGPVPIPSWLADGGGIGTVKPGATGSTTQELPAGRWILIPQSEGDRKVKPQTPVLEVKGGDGGELPQASATISAFEYGFRANGLKAGSNTVEFSNDGKELHHVIATPLLPGRTLAQAQEFFKTEKGRPPIDFENATETTVIDGGQKQVATMDLKAGKYVLVCFITDRAGGPPHAAKGMISEATVSS